MAAREMQPDSTIRYNGHLSRILLSVPIPISHVSVGERVIVSRQSRARSNVLLVTREHPERTETGEIQRE